jgi:hypothetical protein
MSKNSERNKSRNAVLSDGLKMLERLEINRHSRVVVSSQSLLVAAAAWLKDLTAAASSL